MGKIIAIGGGEIRDLETLPIDKEIVNYMHGFHSHLPKLYSHPHKGGVVDKVLIQKGFAYALKQEKPWYKNEWLQLYRELCPEKAARPRIIRRRSMWSVLFK